MKKMGICIGLASLMLVNGVHAANAKRAEVFWTAAAQLRDGCTAKIKIIPGSDVLIQTASSNLHPVTIHAGGVKATLAGGRQVILRGIKLDNLEDAYVTEKHALLREKVPFVIEAAVTNPGASRRAQ